MPYCSSNPTFGYPLQLQLLYVVPEDGVSSVKMADAVVARGEVICEQRRARALLRGIFEELQGTGVRCL